MLLWLLLPAAVAKGGKGEDDSIFGGVFKLLLFFGFVGLLLEYVPWKRGEVETGSATGQKQQI